MRTAVVVGLFIVALTSAIACLNPQPLPPDEQLGPDAASSSFPNGGDTSEDASTESTSDASAVSDGAILGPDTGKAGVDAASVREGGALEGDAATPSEAGDASETDANTDAEGGPRTGSEAGSRLDAPPE